MMKIRAATNDEAGAVREVYLSAFPEGEREVVGELAVKLLLEKAEAPILSLVAEADGVVVGHVAFSDPVGNPPALPG